MKIEVTKSDIKNGIRGRSCLCPVARAIKRVTGIRRDGGVRVFHRFARVGQRRYRFPEKVDSFIWAFDAAQHVEPFSFVMR